MNHNGSFPSGTQHRLHRNEQPPPTQQGVVPKDKKDLIVRTLQNTLTTDNINKAEDGESQLKRVFIKIVDDLGIYYKIGLTTDFTGKLFNEMYSWLGFTQDQLNDVVLTPPYAIRWKSDEVELLPNHYLFMVMCINKVTDLPIYSYKNKLGGWNVVKGKQIRLPERNGKIDFDFIETFISAIKKLAIKDVVLYSDQKIAATKAVVAQKSDE